MFKDNEFLMRNVICFFFVGFVQKYHHHRNMMAMTRERLRTPLLDQWAKAVVILNGNKKNCEFEQKIKKKPPRRDSRDDDAKKKIFENEIFEFGWNRTFHHIHKKNYGLSVFKSFHSLYLIHVVNLSHCVIIEVENRKNRLLSNK